MIRREEQVDILALKRLGYSERRIGRMLGLHRRTVKRDPGERGDTSAGDNVSRLKAGPVQGADKRLA